MTQIELDNPLVCTADASAPAPHAAAANVARGDAAARVLVLCGVLIAGFVVVTSFGMGKSVTYAASTLPWWAFALAFAVTASVVVNIEVHREVHALTFTELPLVIGLFFASPTSLIIARAVGELVVLLWRVRTPQKVLFNQCLVMCQTGVALAVFRLLVDDVDIERPMAWLAAVAAVQVANLIGMAAIGTIIRWHGGGRESLATVIFSTGVEIANSSYALAAGLLLSDSAAAVLLIGALGGLLVVAYRGYSSLAQRYASLQLLYDFSRAISSAKRAESVLGAILEQAQRAMRCEVAEIVLLNADEAAHCFRMRSELDVGTTSSIGDPDAPFWDQVVQQRQVLSIARPTKRGRRPKLLELLNARDVVIAPLLADDGVAGYLLAANRIGDVSTFDGSDARLLETLANHASVALENGRLVERVAREVREREYQAAHDAVTGLPNRSSFVSAVTNALANRPDRKSVV